MRYHLDTPGFRTRQVTLVTTRLDAAVDRVAALAERYRQRWPVETARAQLQPTRHLAVRHGKPVPGVRTDVTGFAIVDHLVRLVMCQSAPRQHSGVARISLLDARRWRGAPSTGVPLGAWIVTPLRPHRVEPRLKKRRPKRFPFMITPRQELRQQLVQLELRG